MKTKWHYQIYRKRPLLSRVLFGTWPFDYLLSGRLIHEGSRHRIVETRLLPRNENRSETHRKLISLLEEIERQPSVIVDICHHHKTIWAKIVKSPGLDQKEVSNLRNQIEAVLATIEAEQGVADQRPTLESKSQ